MWKPEADAVPSASSDNGDVGKRARTVVTASPPVSDEVSHEQPTNAPVPVKVEEWAYPHGVKRPAQEGLGDSGDSGEYMAAGGYQPQPPYMLGTGMMMPPHMSGMAGGMYRSGYPGMMMPAYGMGPPICGSCRTLVPNAGVGGACANCGLWFHRSCLPDPPSASSWQCPHCQTRMAAASAVSPDGEPRPAVVKPDMLSIPQDVLEGTSAPSGESGSTEGWSSARKRPRTGSESESESALIKPEVGDEPSTSSAPSEDMPPHMNAAMLGSSNTSALSSSNSALWNIPPSSVGPGAMVPVGPSPDMSVSQFGWYPPASSYWMGSMQGMGGMQGMGAMPGMGGMQGMGMGGMYGPPMMMWPGHPGARGSRVVKPRRSYTRSMTACENHRMRHHRCPPDCPDRKVEQVRLDRREGQDHQSDDEGADARQQKPASETTMQEEPVLEETTGKQEPSSAEAATKRRRSPAETHETSPVDATTKQKPPGEATTKQQKPPAEATTEQAKPPAEATTDKENPPAETTTEQEQPPVEATTRQQPASSQDAKVGARSDVHASQKEGKESAAKERPSPSNQ